MSETSTSTNLVDAIVLDHRHLEQSFSEYEQGGLDAGARRNLVAHIITELVRHSVAEEQHMYPAARSVLDDGDEIADHEIEEHAEAERVMKDLEGRQPDDPRFDELARQLIDEVRHHVSDEEQDLLPRLQQHCSAEQLDELGRKVLLAKQSAPTRPHPSAPDTPPTNRVLDAGAGLVDRVRDVLNGG